MTSWTAYFAWLGQAAARKIGVKIREFARLVYGRASVLRHTSRDKYHSNHYCDCRRENGGSSSFAIMLGFLSWNLVGTLLVRALLRSLNSGESITLFRWMLILALNQAMLVALRRIKLQHTSYRKALLRLPGIYLRAKRAYKGTSVL